ncbi:PQQ-binding-like beta-propeller repeat protein [Nonomuraea sp. NPDC052634]|uniref:outer membrane protein assembly factor BamB family protein n=1 Tax=Nonomuraea sp. NPDC052634 TaxID=3155813 RepID=UPI0034466BF0
MLSGRRVAGVLLAVAVLACAAADAPWRRLVPIEWRAVWSVSANADIDKTYDTPRFAASGRAVAMATHENTVQIRDPRTGELRRTIPADPSPSTIVTGVWIAAGTLVVARQRPDATGHALTGHDLATGRVLWRRAITVSTEPAVWDDVGAYDGPRILVTERGVVVFERSADPLDIRALDLSTGADTARATYGQGCHLTSAGTARSVTLLSGCKENGLRLASIDPRTLRHRWSRTLSKPSDQSYAGLAIGLTTDAEGHTHVLTGSSGSFHGPDGRPLPRAREAGFITSPERWSPPIYAGTLSAAADPGGARRQEGWPLPAYLISVDPGTGRLGGLPIDQPFTQASLAGVITNMAFVHGKWPGGSRITAYRLIYGPPRERSWFGGVPASAWPDACGLLTERDLSLVADGYRAVPWPVGPPGKAGKCDWVPPGDGDPVVSLSVEWVSPSDAGARRLFARDEQAIEATDHVDPTTESPGFLTYTVDETNGYYGGTLMNVGPVIVRLTSPSRQAVRLLSPLLRNKLFARYRPGAAVPVPAHADGWSHPTDAIVHAGPVVTGGVAYATSGDGTVTALDAASGARRWRFPTGGVIHNGHVVVDGTVYAANESGRLVALDTATGRPRWSRKLLVVSDLASAGGRLYAWTRRSHLETTPELVALSQATGERLWTFRPKGLFPVKSYLVLMGDAVHVGGGNGMVDTLEAASGARKWRARAGGATDFIQLTRSGAVLYAASARGEVRALDAATGEVLWRAAIGAAIGFRPVVTGGRLYLGDKEGTTYVLDAATGKPLWNHHTTGGAFQYNWAIAVARGRAYISGLDGRLHALDAATGTSRWTFPLGRDRGTGPVVADGTVYIGDDEGTLHALDAGTGVERRSFRAGGRITTEPVVTGGFVFVGSSNGNVYGFPVPTP